MTIELGDDEKPKNRNFKTLFKEWATQEPDYPTVVEGAFRRGFSHGVAEVVEALLPLLPPPGAVEQRGKRLGL